MDLTYKKCTLEDLDELTETRIEVLRAANLLSAEADMEEVRDQSRIYYEKALQDGSHVAYLVYDGGAFVGAGGVSFYQVMPTYHDPSGRKAYIMNMYTKPAYRRRGIALKTLGLLVEECRAAGVTAITLEATDAGRPLYEAYGFVPMTHEMELPEEIVSEV
jgi:GNAT superfamily N-acetyltransferase